MPLVHRPPPPSPLRHVPYPVNVERVQDQSRRDRKRLASEAAERARQRAEQDERERDLPRVTDAFGNVAVIRVPQPPALVDPFAALQERVASLESNIAEILHLLRKDPRSE